MKAPAARGKPSTKRAPRWALLFRMASSAEGLHTWCRELQTPLQPSTWQVNVPLRELLLPGAGHARALPVEASPTCPPVHLLDEVVSSVQVVRMGDAQRGAGAERARPASFQNICGTVRLGDTAPLRALLCDLGDGRNPLLVRVSTRFGCCTEMYTLHGTAAFRDTSQEGLSMSFKGVRDVGGLCTALDEVVGREWALAREGACTLVHMAIVTLVLGRGVSIGQDCLLIYTLRRMTSDACIKPCVLLEDNFGGVHFQVSDWGPIHDLAAGKGAGGARPAAVGRATASVVTVTYRGSMIIRFSWDPPTPWSDRVARQVLADADALAGACIGSV